MQRTAWPRSTRAAERDDPVAVALERVRRARTDESHQAATRRLLYELRSLLSPLMRTNLKIIGLTGNPAAGKDTVGAILSARFGFARLAFADALRHEVMAAYQIVDDYWFVDRHAKDALEQRWAIGRCDSREFVARAVSLGWDLYAPRSPRQILQLWGTEYRRAQDPGYWVRQAELRVLDRIGQGITRLVMTDCRFRNEAFWLRSLGGEIWRVDRRESLAHVTPHQSDHAMADTAVDRTVMNDGSLADLQHEIARLARAAGL